MKPFCQTLGQSTILPGDTRGFRTAKEGLMDASLKGLGRKLWFCSLETRSFCDSRMRLAAPSTNDQAPGFDTSQRANAPVRCQADGFRLTRPRPAHLCPFGVRGCYAHSLCHGFCQLCPRRSQSQPGHSCKVGPTRLVDKNKTIGAGKKRLRQVSDSQKNVLSKPARRSHGEFPFGQSDT